MGGTLEAKRTQWGAGGRHQFGRLSGVRGHSAARSCRQLARTHHRRYDEGWLPVPQFGRASTLAAWPSLALGVSMWLFRRRVRSVWLPLTLILGCSTWFHDAAPRRRVVVRIAPLATRRACLSLAFFHGYLELAVGAFLWVRGSAATADGATPQPALAASSVFGNNAGA